MTCGGTIFLNRLDKRFKAVHQGAWGHDDDYIPL